jgi:hypothetical protein
MRASFSAAAAACPSSCTATPKMQKKRSAGERGSASCDARYRGG